MMEAIARGGASKVKAPQGIFAPAVLGAKKVMGEQRLKEFRASVIAEHTKVISNFVDTSDSPFGQLVLRQMFEAADKDGSGDLSKEEDETRCTLWASPLSKTSRWHRSGRERTRT